MRRTIPLLAALLALAAPASAMADSGGELFVPSAHENGDNAVTLPLHRGTSGGRDVWFFVLDASTGEAAKAWGPNRSNRLENARGTAAVQTVTVRDGVIDFAAGVDFAPRAPGRARADRLPARGGRARRGQRTLTRRVRGRPEPPRGPGRP